MRQFNYFPIEELIWERKIVKCVYSGVGKLFSRKAVLTIQELAKGRIDHLRVDEDQCLKSCNSCIQCKSLHLLKILG